ncbi:hypothetical protein Cadr_000000466 [Camelus dromedarius]|uniref:Uncharacterized protein n=1 Tax=Camelus dromedarius TaxID=9838 RepID=A0A5N4EKI0_CAMDR|nr:hypothetical protein Cadr_000000466 [Camelus dromedarius]
MALNGTHTFSTSAEPNNRYQGLARLCLYLPNGKQSPWENSGGLNTLVKH